MIANQFLINNEAASRSYIADRASEQPKRSIAKSISWRTIGTLDTILISWIITGTLSLAFSIGLVELVTKMVLYFLHERLWNTIKWGR